MLVLYSILVNFNDLIRSKNTKKYANKNSYLLKRYCFKFILFTLQSKNKESHLWISQVYFIDLKKLVCVPQ